MVNGVGAAALAGVGAGLGVAVPLGAVGVLLLEEGRRGRAAAVSAACAVAFVDMAYAALATALGSRLASVLSGWEAWARAAAAVVLVLVAVRGLLGLRREPAVGPRQGQGTAAGPEPGPGDAGAAVTAPAGPGRVFLRFAALTAVNPTTALYFAALVTGGGAGALSGGPYGAAAGSAFVAGVLAASLTWQQLLAAVGVSLGARLSPRVRRVTYCVGYGLVVYYAVRTAWTR
ncbi:LysE family transporter [Kitasatospora sp. A2-31]|uniref:LysE family transporter n=1 Tax=Kitasatospora sp. A2-31 TaxID=2916414 RepID=UPI001EEABE08|nr:LysE family transporter [Kitasatospora sp. A2-31]MCG6498275.1 LysE family transporter [Kitasatospora sp. A2-31]